jgi:hypothetical protein
VDYVDYTNDENDEEWRPANNANGRENSIKRQSFALIRVIRGQTCLSVLFQGGGQTRAGNSRLSREFSRFADHQITDRLGLTVTAADAELGAASVSL